MLLEIRRLRIGWMAFLAVQRALRWAPALPAFSLWFVVMAAIGVRLREGLRGLLRVL